MAIYDDTTVLIPSRHGPPDAYLRCGNALRPVKVLERSDQLMARGLFAKVVLLDVDTPGASATWQPVEKLEPVPRQDLVEHLRAQIERDPEAFANPTKLNAAVERMVARIREAGRS